MDAFADITLAMAREQELLRAHSSAECSIRLIRRLSLAPFKSADRATVHADDVRSSGPHYARLTALNA